MATALVAALGLAALLYVAWHTEPAWLLTGAILLSAFSGNWDIVGLPGGIAPDRLALFVAIAGILFRSPAVQDRPPLRIEPVHVLMAATLTWALGSAIASETLSEGETPFLLLDRLAVPFAVFLLAPYAFRTDRQRQALLASLVAFGGYLGLTALFETIGAKALIFPQFISDPDLGYQADRARGPFLESSVNGMALFVCLVAAAIGWTRFEPRWARNASGAVLGLCALGLLLTLTRSVWVAAIAASVVTMIATPELRRRLLPACIAVALGTVLALVGIPGLESRFEERTEADRSVWERRNTNAAALNVISDRPLLGTGVGRFEEESAEHFPVLDDAPQVTQDAVHNVFLLFGVELGLIGAGLFVASFLIAVAMALLARGPPELRPWKIGLVAIAVFWVVLANFAPIGFVFASTITWLWAAVIVGGANFPQTPRAE